MPDFMQREITNKQSWIEIETDNGTEYIDAVTLGLMIRDSQPVTHPLSDKDRESIIAKLSPYTNGTIQEWKTIKGFGCRLSVPGYLDCTEWTVFDTAQECEDFLNENYPEESADDSEEL